jgi:purine-nucleoside phosphorylase
MGMASAAIYIHELVNNYQVKKLVRVGTCGSLQKNLALGQVILSMSASGDSSVNQTYFDQMDFAPTADFGLLKKAYDAAKKLNIPAIVGPVFSSDRFYDFPGETNRWKKWSNHGVLAVDMESQILYTLAARFGISGLSILTVSDNIITGDGASQEEREKSYSDMMKIALELP